MTLAEKQDAIAQAIGSFSFNYANEDDLQAGIAEALDRHGFSVEREVCLGARERIDLLVDGEIGIEVKTASSCDRVRRQLERYAKSDRVKALVLVSTRATHIRLSGAPLADTELRVVMAFWGAN